MSWNRQQPTKTLQRTTIWLATWGTKKNLFSSFISLSKEPSAEKINFQIQSQNQLIFVRNLVCIIVCKFYSLTFYPLKKVLEFFKMAEDRGPYNFKIFCMHFGGNFEFCSNDLINISFKSGQKMTIVLFVLYPIVYYCLSESLGQCFVYEMWHYCVFAESERWSLLYSTFHLTIFLKENHCTISYLVNFLTLYNNAY